MARVNLNEWVVYRGLTLVGRREGGEETDPFNLIFFFNFHLYSGDPAETRVTNINHQSSNDGKICLAHVTRSIIRWWQRRRRRN